MATSSGLGGVWPVSYTHLDVYKRQIPTINVTKEFQWNSPVVDKFMEITCKYGIPYFSNYVSSDLSPEDALSMCCRLRLDTKELRKRGGGLFGSNPLTGSIGVVTINLPRIAYLSKNCLLYTSAGPRAPPPPA